MISFVSVPDFAESGFRFGPERPAEHPKAVGNLSIKIT